MVRCNVRYLLFIFLVCCTSLAIGQEVRLTAKTETDTFPLGSWINVQVDGKLNANVDSIAPAVRDSIGSFEVVTVERKGNDPQWMIRLTATDSGKVFLPPIEFSYKVKNDTNAHKAYTNSLLLTIAGVSIDPNGEIKDIKPPMSAPWLFEDFLPYLIALLVISGLAGAYYYYRKKKKLKEDMLADVKVLIPPHRRAMTALRVLEEKKLWQQGLVKEYYSEVTMIVREFF